MIYNVIQKLKSIGIENVIINTHHLSEQVEDYFSKNDFGIEINFIHEEEILGTGGAIKNARDYLNDCENFLVYNVDVNSDIDVNEMYKFHMSKDSLATLAVKMRETSRPLLMGADNKLIGRIINGKKEIYAEAEYNELETGFCGIHIISQQIFDFFYGYNAFDIMPVYMDLVKKNKKIMCFDIGSANWEDLGKAPKLETNSNSFS
jgi:NDP-sugar pyrophosphorylase family protein